MTEPKTVCWCDYCGGELYEGSFCYRLDGLCICPDELSERAALRHEIALLSGIMTQCRELAELTAHYYERGFYRDEKYTL